MAHIDRILEAKRDGAELVAADIERFVQAAIAGKASRAQVAAFLSFVFIRGMTDAETVALTMSMANSGERLQWSFDGKIADKHSTGGVGDKVSLVLAPLWATMGVKIPMISGRGLGHTGGTLDKLESIPGFRSDLDLQSLKDIFAKVGCFICGQTAELAPADRLFYALRNEVCLVPSIPLIVASILSKKLAEGIDSLVMDVKWGSGAFMRNQADAQQLADQLVAVGTGAGLQVRAVLSDMNQPLGRTVGNALEVQEAIRCLQGEGPQDLSQLVCQLIGDSRASEVLRSGAAFDKWEQMIVAQGGDPQAPLRGSSCKEQVIEAPLSGTLTSCDALQIGQASLHLGAGRFRADQDIHHGVGFILHCKQGEQVEKGQPLITMKHAEKGLEEALVLLQKALVIEPL